MYVAGNPMRYVDPDGHGWGMGKIASIVGAVVGGLLGAQAVGAAYLAKKVWNSDKVRNTIRSERWRSATWNKWGDTVIGAGIGFALGGLFANLICGGLGYFHDDTWGNKDWVEGQWDSWGRTTLCIIAISVLIIAGVLLGSPMVVICTIIGTILGGTRMQPFSKEAWNKWSWEYATLGAAIGFTVGIIGQYGFGTNNYGGGRLGSDIIRDQFLHDTLRIGTYNWKWYVAVGTLVYSLLTGKDKEFTIGSIQF